MTITSTPVTIQSGGETAEMFRRLFWSQMNGRPGIVSSGDLAVTQNGTPNMSVNVADGRAFVLGSESGTQGIYFIENRNTQNLVISASHASLARFDLVVARIRDAAYSGATNSAALEVVTGTPAGSPVDPTVPANCLVLARVVVAAASTTVTNAFIDDIRAGASGYTNQNGRAAALGGVVTCTSTSRPTVSLATGQVAFETNTNKTYQYDGATWRKIADLGAWATYVPTWTQSATITKTVTRSEYSWVGRQVSGVVQLSATSAGTASNTIQVSTPVTAAWASNQVIGSGYYYNGSINFPITVMLNTTTTFAFIPAFTAGGGFFGGATVFYASAAGANTGFTPTVASGHAIVFNYCFEASVAATS